MSVAYVARIDAVEKHPDEKAAHMSVLVVGDLKGVSQNVVGNTPDVLDKPRYKVGDLIVVMIKNAVLPEDVLRMGFWDPTKNDGAGGGMLPKSNGTRVWPKKFHDFNSEFITFPVFANDDTTGYFVQRGSDRMTVDIGTDVEAFFGVTEFKP